MESDDNHKCQENKQIFTTVGLSDGNRSGTLKLSDKAIFINTLFAGSKQTAVETPRQSPRETDSGRETANIGGLWTAVTHTHCEEISPRGAFPGWQGQVPEWVEIPWELCR